MKVLLANTNCKSGGVSTFMLALRQQLLQRGHSCRLFFFEHGPMEEHLPPGVEYHVGDLADCLRVVDQAGIDLVHGNNIDWLVGLSAVRRLGVPLVLTAHKVRPPAGTYGWTARNCDALVTVSGWICDDLKPLTDVPVHVIYNGIDTTRFQPADHEPSSPPIVAWVGRGGAGRKRLEAFAAAAPILRAHGARIWVVDSQGPAVFAERFPEAAEQLAAVAEMWGPVAFGEMPSVYHRVAASGGCLVSTASMEGLPLTILEAQACGCIVVAADVDGVNECITPECGTLFPFETTPQRLADIVLEAVADPAEVRRRQRQAAAYVEREFSLEQMTERYVALYQALVEQPVRRGAGVASIISRKWKRYIEYGLGVAYRQYEASRKLAAEQEWRLAGAAAGAALETGPTMYLRPTRAQHLLRCMRFKVTGQGDDRAPRTIG